VEAALGLGEEREQQINSTLAPLILFAQLLASRLSSDIAS
jgi:hypothetical protein